MSDDERMTTASTTPGTATCGEPATIYGRRFGAPFTEVTPCQREAGHPDNGHGLDLETLRRNLPEGVSLFPETPKDPGQPPEGS